MTDEAVVRRQLGIPDDAAEVVVVCESTHWDPDWLLTSNEYLRLMVAPTLDRALDALEAEPRRVYSVECAFYPDAYLRVRPERTEQFVRLANEGRLRFTGSGVTTPDTLLPEDEALLRDLLEGNEWLRARGITAEVRSLYLPDSFGHSPGVPALLNAAGVEYASIVRIDGMRFPGAELEAADHFPVPRTTAARLTEEGTADFIWRAPDGSEVLTHWNAFGYGHADMIGHGGFTRAMGLPLAWPSRDSAKVAARIEAYVDQLRPLMHTPYGLLTIGFDFSRPVTRLIELFDEWNATGYERTGVWLVNAALDDYLDLVATHRDALPTLEVDPNPYWTGFYATRPALKRACRDLGRDLVTLDNLRARRRLSAPPANECDDSCGDARWIAATTNHHDLVTGTSPDRTARREQWPWLHQGRDQIRTAIASLGVAPPSTTAPSANRRTGMTVGRRHGSHVTVETSHFTAIFDEAHGGTLVSLANADGQSLVHPRSLSLVAIAESGGLWRMGCEFPGGTWRRVAATDDHPASVSASRDETGVTVTIDASLERRPVRITVTFSDDAPTIGVATEVTPRLRRTVTLQWRGTTPINRLTMHQPGAVVTRPLQRRYEPTFWPLHSWAVTNPGPATAGSLQQLALATAVPTAIHAFASGTVETVVARTALRELAWGVVPLLGPALGYERGVETAHLMFGWHDTTVPVHRTGRDLQRLVDQSAGRIVPEWAVTVDDVDTEILTTQPAQRGDGIIVRLRDWDVNDLGRTIRLAIDPSLGVVVREARRCDSNERDGTTLSVIDGQVIVPLDAHLVSIRLHTGS